MRTRPLFDIVALLARIVVGVIFIAHGWQKIQVGITATSKSLDGMGVPAPTAAAIYATFAELLGGLALIAGLGLPVAGTALFLDMAGAFVFVHLENGLFLVDQGRVRNGFELALTLGLVSLLFAVGAGGRLSLDHHLFARSGERPRERDEDTWPPEEDPEAPWPPPAESPSPSPSGTTKPIPVAARDEPSPPPAKPRQGRMRRKPSAKEPSPSSSPEEAPAGTESGTPRLAADIIGDSSRDVRVAGKRRPRNGDA